MGIVAKVEVSDATRFLSSWLTTCDMQRIDESNIDDEVTTLERLDHSSYTTYTFNTLDIKLPDTTLVLQ